MPSLTSQELQEAISLAKSRSDCHPENIETLVATVASTISIPGDIIECGSYKCGASIAMAATADFHQTGKTVYAMDLFGGLPYGEGIGFENFANVDLKEIIEVTSYYPNITLIPGRHEDTVPDFCNRFKFNVSLLFMDSDHYESHVVCLKHFWPRLSLHGIVVFHDWSFPGVQQAIREVIPTEEIFESRKFSLSPNMGYIVKK